MVEQLNDRLSAVDPEIQQAVARELDRQQSTLEMIASENFAPAAVMEAQGSVLTNKYAEGYPGKRYYGGCEHVDVVEQLAIDRVKALFGAEFANVQPHSGAQANAAAMFALLNPGDTIMGLDLAHGGHLTHGMRINFSGKLYNVVPYHVRESDFRVDMAEVEALALEHRPKLIVAGWSAYSRQLDFAEFRRIADLVGAYLMVDMAHFAGLVAAGLHPNPVPYADVVTTTTHKTLGGPRGGVILAKEQYAKKINSAVFPGQQGGPLEHVIAAKAVAFKLAATEGFKERQERVLEGAKLLAERFLQPDVEAAGITVVNGGTDVHLVLVDLRNSELDGQQAEDTLHRIGITVNRNAVPFDPRPPMVSSGLRIGTPALATRGFGAAEFTEVADIIATALIAVKPARRHRTLDDGTAVELRARVTALAEQFPLYPQLSGATAIAALRRHDWSGPVSTHQLPEHPDFLWRNPEPKSSYDAVIVGGGGHGLATAYFLAKNHGMTNIAVLEKGWLAGGNMARNTTIIRSNYLWDESAAIYEHALKLWEILPEELEYDFLFSQRGVMNLAHTLGDVRESIRRVGANKLNGVDAEWLDPQQVKELCPILNISDDIRYPVMGATYQPRAGIAKHDHVAWAFARKCDELGVDIIQNCEVTGFVKDGNRVVGRQDQPRHHQHRKGGPRAPPATARSWPKWPASASPSSPTRCRHSSPSCTSRSTPPSSCPTTSTCTSPRPTRANWSWAPASTPTTATASAVPSTSSSTRWRPPSSCSRSLPGHTCCGPGAASWTPRWTPRRSWAPPRWTTCSSTAAGEPAASRAPRPPA